MKGRGLKSVIISKMYTCTHATSYFCNNPHLTRGEVTSSSAQGGFLRGAGLPFSLHTIYVSPYLIGRDIAALVSHQVNQSDLGPHLKPDLQLLTINPDRNPRSLAQAWACVLAAACTCTFHFSSAQGWCT